MLRERRVAAADRAVEQRRFWRQPAVHRGPAGGQVPVPRLRHVLPLAACSSMQARAVIIILCSDPAHGCHDRRTAASCGFGLCSRPSHEISELRRWKRRSRRVSAPNTTSSCGGKAPHFLAALCYLMRRNWNPLCVWMWFMMPKIGRAILPTTNSGGTKPYGAAPCAWMWSMTPSPLMSACSPGAGRCSLQMVRPAHTDQMSHGQRNIIKQVSICS